MYFGVTSTGYEHIINDETWRDCCRKDCKEIRLNSCKAYVLYNTIYFYFHGKPWGYGGDEHILKEQTYGRRKSPHICAIRNVKVEYMVVADDDIYMTRLGNILITYKKTYPEIEGSTALTMDTIDGMKITRDSNGRILKIGYWTI